MVKTRTTRDFPLPPPPPGVNSKRSLHLVLVAAVLVALLLVPVTLFYSGLLSNLFRPSNGFDYSLSAAPQSTVAAPGQTVNYSISIVLTAGTAQNVVLAFSGLPSSVGTHSFNLQSSEPNFTSILTIATLSSAMAGNYSLSITSAGGGITHSVSLALAVIETESVNIVTGNPVLAVSQSISASGGAIDVTDSSSPLSARACPTHMQAVRNE